MSVIRSVLVAGAALGCSGLVACSYIFELPTVNPVVADGAADAGIDDAADIDAEPFDGESPLPLVRFCERDASPAVYCLDFDDTAPPDLDAIGTVTTERGQLTPSSAVAHLSARSLFATTTGANASATVLRPLGVDPDGVSFSFRQLVSAWSTTEARLARVAVAGCSITLVGNATVWSLEATCPAAADVIIPTTSPIVRGRWQRFTIGVRFAPTPEISLYIDDVRIADAPAPKIARGPVSVGLGVTLALDGNVALFQDEALVTSP